MRFAQNDVREPQVGDYVLWEYATWPFLCGGVVTKVKRTPEGFAVQTTEYGPGYWWRPAIVLDLASGKALACELRQLSLIRAQALAAREEQFSRRLQMMLKRCANALPVRD